MKVTIPLETALMIQVAFLPKNERKMRGADPRVVEAVKTFKAAVQEAHLQEAAGR